jgi:stage V sporulation protein D (sporulation-specific penicillin-binding protein)
VAGKTGTAQVIGDDGRYATDRHVASFVGWAPARDPAFVALVVLDAPEGSYHGGQVAAPAFASLARDVLRYLEIPPRPSPLGGIQTVSGGLSVP